MNTLNRPVDPVNTTNGGRAPGTDLEPKVYDAELITNNVGPEARSEVGPWAPTPRPVRSWRRLAGWFAAGVCRMWRSDVVVRARSVAAYRLRQLPRDGTRLVWFVLRGHWRWLVKFWNWATYADLRADARNARLAGDPEARRAAQELIRSDAKARWAKVGIALHRAAVAVRMMGPLVVVLWTVDAFLDRADMWSWLAGVYTGLDAMWTVLAAAIPAVIILAPLVWVIAVAFEGRDKTPGAGWLIHPDRDDADSWIDERMISKALAHLGISPLNAFFKDGGQLHYSVAARVDGDGTYAQIRLPLGVTADMVADRRDKLAANLGRAKLETWPTEGEEAGILDLWVADKGKLGGGAGDWPLLHEGRVDLFQGVPFGLTQRGVIVNAPLIAANWLVGGRPGQGKSSVLRTLMLGAALDPTAELWVFVMGESPDFAPFQPRFTRYRMGMDDAVAEAATQALEDLLAEMERRGKTLGAQPGQPPKVSRQLADRRELALHPLVCAIDECHELFQHPKFGKRAAELAVRLIKRGRKYGIVLLLATQSPTKDSIPREVTRNISCGVAFAVADHVANDGLLGTGKYRAGIRATDLRMHTDRGTCVAVGVTDDTFELIRTFYVAFEDGIDDVSPIIARAMAIIAEEGRAVTATARAEIEATPVDHLADIAAVLRGQPRVRTQVVLGRLIEHNPAEYEGWSLSRLAGTLAEHRVTVGKSDGRKVIRAADIARALATRTDADIERVEHGAAGHDGRDADREPPGLQGLIPDGSLTQSPRVDQHKPTTGTRPTETESTTGNPRNQGLSPESSESLPDTDEGGGHDG